MGRRKVIDYCMTKSSANGSLDSPSKDLSPFISKLDLSSSISNNFSSIVSRYCEKGLTSLSGLKRTGVVKLVSVFAAILLEPDCFGETTSSLNSLCFEFVGAALKTSCYDCPQPILFSKE
jgi:hypothetical protein